VLSGFIRFLHRQDAEQALMYVGTGNVIVNGASIQAKWARNNSRINMDFASTQAHQPPPQASAIGGAMLRGTAAAAAAASNAFARYGSPSLPSGFTSASAAAEGVRTLFVGSVPFGATDADVVHAFAQLGLEGQFTLNTTKPSSKGNSGFLKFESHFAAAEALAVCNAAKPTVHGQELMLQLAKADSR